MWVFEIFDMNRYRQWGNDRCILSAIGLLYPDIKRLCGCLCCFCMSVHVIPYMSVKFDICQFMKRMSERFHVPFLIPSSLYLVM